ncbi:sphingosine kinase [Pleurocapsales cyanobacterium LEGE 10410]|nr:sphingosine kinase [Pleurocapsales cyanobacterium LEGE 10410]
MKSYIFEHQLAVAPQQPNDKGYLTEDTLFWQHNGIAQQLALNDVVGVSVVDRQDNLPGLLVNAYPLVDSQLPTKQQRILKEYYFTCPNLEVRSQWQRAISNALVGKPIDAAIEPRHVQIIINPVSGKGQAAQIFERVRALFDKSNLEYTVAQTYSAADTKDLVYNLNSDLDGLVIVGGDGTIHDAIASLMSRPDWQTAIKIPLGVIPGGTGNGLCKTLLESSKEAYDPLNAAFLIAKGKQQSLDIAAIRQNDAKYYSFLSLAWGLISDIDIKSEKLKFLGSLRFDLYALMSIGLLRTYRGRFSFIPHSDFELSRNRAISQQGKWRVIEDEFVFLWAMNTAWAAHDMNVTPYAQLNDGAMDVLVMRKGTSRLELLTALLRCGRGQHLDLPHMEYYKVRSFRLEPLTKKGILVVDGEPVDYSPVEMKIMPHLACVNG